MKSIREMEEGVDYMTDKLTRFVLKVLIGTLILLFTYYLCKGIWVLIV